MTSEKRAQKFHTDDASLVLDTDCDWSCRWWNFLQPTRMGSDVSSVLNSCARFSDVISRLNRWWRRKMSAVFLRFLTELILLRFMMMGWAGTELLDFFLISLSSFWNHLTLTQNKLTWIIFFKHCYRYSIKRVTNKENDAWRRFEIES